MTSKGRRQPGSTPYHGPRGQVLGTPYLGGQPALTAAMSAPPGRSPPGGSPGAGPAAEALVRAVLDAARPEPGQAVLELYSGAGLLSLPLARAVGEDGRVVTLEGSATAVKDARRNLHDHPNVALGTGLVRPKTVREGGAGCDVVVLDPPRAGAGTKVMRAITELAPARIVHVACDPAALARDLAAARDGGLRRHGR
ncbi:methyltransferase [Georgenia sp. SUBG003]|uniref:methyltransferase n=1 Tax=Georgenia sp. SUBG003 TaxID=1497974 RepID=UPI003AB4643C